MVVFTVGHSTHAIERLIELLSAQGVELVADVRRERPTAVMCAEGDWRRCHRRILSDVLVARGWEVRHIAPDGSTSPHALTEFAVVEDGLPRYPAAQLELGI